MVNETRRILIVGRERELLDRVTRLLETAGYIVTSTLDDGVAVDLAGSSDYAALLIGGEVSELDRRYVRSEARSRSPLMAILTVHSIQSVLTQLRQAGITI